MSRLHPEDLRALVAAILSLKDESPSEAFIAHTIIDSDRFLADLSRTAKPEANGTCHVCGKPASRGFVFCSTQCWEKQKLEPEPERVFGPSVEEELQSTRAMYRDVHEDWRTACARAERAEAMLASTEKALAQADARVAELEEELGNAVRVGQIAEEFANRLGIEAAPGNEGIGSYWVGRLACEVETLRDRVAELEAARDGINEVFHLRAEVARLQTENAQAATQERERCIQAAIPLVQDGYYTWNREQVERAVLAALEPKQVKP
jgi:hypothetical protein